MNRLDNAFFYSCFVAVVLAACAVAANDWFFHYEIVEFPLIALEQLSFVLAIVVYIVGFYLSRHHERVALFCKVLGMVFLVPFVMLIIEMGAFTTPFPLRAHDQIIHVLDGYLGFNILAIVTTMHAYPLLVKISFFVYHLLYPVIIIIPLVLALLNDKREAYQYPIAYMIAAIIGFTVYYFWPTGAPADVVSSPYFPPQEKLLIQQFTLEHTHQAIKLVRSGFVSLPSYHTIWAVLVACCCYHRKALFYPVAIFSALVILSTFTTGWHFLLDDVAGVIIALASFYLARKLVRLKCFTDQRNPQPSQP